MTQNPPRFVVDVSVPKLWPGETAVILGGGSSLTPADVNYVRGKARVIAIKEAVQLAPWADVLYACDSKYWQFYKGVPDFLGPKYRLEPQMTEPAPVTWPGVAVLRNTGDEGLELDPTGLRTGSNSGYQAVNLAVHFGVTQIVLLGFDMWNGPDGRQNWFGPHPNHTPTPYPILHQRFATIIEPLKAIGVDVLNASRFTVLRAFPRVALEEVLS